MRLLIDLVLAKADWNEHPVVRFVRLSLMAGAAAAVTAAMAAVPGVDWPGSYDPLVGGMVLAALAGADKWLRNHRAA